MRGPLEELRDILEQRDANVRSAVPDISNSEEPHIAGVRLGLGVRKPSQKMLLSQIFGTPDNPEESALQKYFRIRREQI